MYIAKAAAVLAAALFCLASPATANGLKTTTKTKNSLVGKLKSAGVGRGGMWPKGEVFSFYVAYGDVPPTTGNDLRVMVDEGQFKYVMYEKPVYGDAAKTIKIGNALYNIQIFEHDIATNPGIAEGNYQNVQNIPLVDKTGKTRDVYININGRIEYKLVPGQSYPFVTQASLLSLAVSSLEADGIACTNVGITPITTPGTADMPSITEYIVDARKAICVQQGSIEG